MTGVGDGERQARLTLACAVEPGRYALGRLVSSAGAESAVAQLREGRSDLDRSGAIRDRLSRVDVAGLVERATQLGLRFICPGDHEWPPALDALTMCEPREGLGEVPFGLWVRGAGDLMELTRRSVSVVGARAATDYGMHVAGEIAADLTEAGWTVVSGAAYGIDAAAHRGSLAVGGVTVGVLACGADIAYPRGNASLIDRMAATGVIVSECAPGSPPSRGRFLARNRLIAAMTCGTVVVEAALRSGALNTANWAADLYRPVMAVPGPVTSALSQGCHQLVREQNAELVTAATDVIGAVATIGEHVPEARRGPERPWDRLSPELKCVLDAVPASAPIPVEAIADMTGLGTSSCLEALTRLRESGLVEEAVGGWWIGPAIREATRKARRGGA